MSIERESGKLAMGSKGSHEGFDGVPGGGGVNEEGEVDRDDNDGKEGMSNGKGRSGPIDASGEDGDGRCEDSSPELPVAMTVQESSGARGSHRDEAHGKLYSLNHCRSGAASHCAVTHSENGPSDPGSSSVKGWKGGKEGCGVGNRDTGIELPQCSTCPG